MALTLPNGSVISLASGYSTADTVTAVTNAAPPVATVTNTFSTGDICEVTSGWAHLNSKIVRLSAVTGTTVDYENIDTTSTSTYPAGAGTGSIRKVTGWTPIQQVTTVTAQGGVQQFLKYQFLELDIQQQIPTIKDAAALELKVADDPTLAGYILAAAANDDRLPRAVRVAFPNGAFMYFNAYVSLLKTPALTINQAIETTITLSYLNEPVRYTS